MCSKCYTKFRDLSLCTVEYIYCTKPLKYDMVGKFTLRSNNSILFFAICFLVRAGSNYRVIFTFILQKHSWTTRTYKKWIYPLLNTYEGF
jgi:hypothetical protein